jgi:hypothetical protein
LKKESDEENSATKSVVADADGCAWLWAWLRASTTISHDTQHVCLFEMLSRKTKATKRRGHKGDAALATTKQDYRPNPNNMTFPSTVFWKESKQKRKVPRGVFVVLSISAVSAKNNVSQEHLYFTTLLKLES